MRPESAVRWTECEVMRAGILRVTAPIRPPVAQEVAVLVPSAGASVVVDGAVAGRRYRGVVDSGFVSVLPSLKRLELQEERPGNLLLLALDPDFIAAGLSGPMQLRGMPRAIDPVLTRIGRELMSELEGGDGPGEAALRFTAEQVRLHLCTHYARRSRRHVTQPLSAERTSCATAFIREHFAMKNLSVSDIAQSVSLSAFHFTRMFAAATGTAPHAFLTQIRLEHARRLLAETCLPIAEVANRCGYATHAHFTGVFGRHVGLTPAAYRTQVRAERAAARKRPA